MQLPTLFGPAVGFNDVCHSEIRRRNDSVRVVGVCPAATWTVITPRNNDNAGSVKEIPPLPAQVNAPDEWSPSKKSKRSASRWKVLLVR